MADRNTILQLKLIAAKAEQLASDLERGALWEGELQQGLSEIHTALERVKA